MRRLLRRWFGDAEIEDVRTFHETVTGTPNGHFPTTIPTYMMVERIKFLKEELDELTTATKHQDLPEIADALVDLVYVAKGTALMLGLPWEQLWDEVQRANMDKVRGTTKRGMEFDAQKPVGWRPPQHIPILSRAGWLGYAWDRVVD